MGMPVIVPGTGTRDQAITDIIESVALQEAGLAHIINAEGEKIQKIVAMATTSKELIEVNASVRCMIDSITHLEMLLKSKISTLVEDC